LFRLGGQADAQILDDLVLQFFAAVAPAARAGELFHAAAQAAKAHDAGRLPELGAQLVAQAREKEKFQAVGGFARKTVEVGRAGVWRARFDDAGADGQAESVEDFSRAMANSPTVTVSRRSSRLK